MMLAEISEQGIALWITAIAGAIGAAAFSLYTLYRRTMRQEETADAKAKIESASDDATFWQKQYEQKCQSDLQWERRILDKQEYLEARFTKLEAEHFLCQEEHAQARGQMASMQRDLESKDKRIAELERLVGKI